MADITTRYNSIQQIKRRFFAMRNGVVADVLRRAGSPYRIIFGLNLPQITDIAYETEKSREIAEQLWANSTTRESMLIAPMLMPFENFTIEDARAWSASVTDIECADVLCLRLLRHLEFAPELAVELAPKDNVERYVGARLARNIVYHEPETANVVARKIIEIDSSDAAARVAQSILEEIDYCGLLN